MSNRDRIGDLLWFAEWVESLGYVDSEHPEYGLDPDLHRYRTRRFLTREEAEAFAAATAATSPLGVVEIWPAEYTAYDPEEADLYPHAGYWLAVSDPEFIEAPEQEARS